jgi:hypothetical protein
MTAAGLPVPNSFDGGRTIVHRNLDGTGNGWLELRAPTYTTTIAAGFDAAGTVSGTATAATHRFLVNGPAAEPVIEAAPLER